MTPIEEADVYDDVVNKIDYVVSRNKHDRGIEVRAEDNDGDGKIGIQFTLMFKKTSIEGKAETVLAALRRGIIGETNILDIALVSIHPACVKRAINKWKKVKVPGGPDRQLEKAVKIDILRKVLKTMFSETEIDEMIANIFRVDRKK